MPMPDEDAQEPCATWWIEVDGWRFLRQFAVALSAEEIRALYPEASEIAPADPGNPGPLPDPEAIDPLDDRRRCIHCTWYCRDGSCLAAARGLLPGTARRFYPDPQEWHRCRAFRDQRGRTALEVFDWAMALLGRRPKKEELRDGRDPTATTHPELPSDRTCREPSCRAHAA